MVVFSEKCRITHDFQNRYRSAEVSISQAGLFKLPLLGSAAIFDFAQGANAFNPN